jgi:phage terminase large subunit-like protein
MQDADRSPAERWCRELVALVGPDAASEHLDLAWSELTVVERAAVAYDWWEFWARPKQIPPEGDWRSFGSCCGRGFGKTDANAHVVHREAIEGRAMRILLMAQSEERGLADMVEGVSGLLEAAPPWERPTWERGRLLWPNGAQAELFSPEKPTDVRGPGGDLAWAAEITAWPRTKAREAWSNLRFMLRLGKARLVWDCTPKKKHEILREQLARGERAPARHVVVRGSSRENASNINTDELAELELELAGTTRGREEIEGEFIDELGQTLVQQQWIDEHRASMPARFERRILSIDPATTVKKHSDATGMVEEGLVSKTIYVIADHSDHYPWEEWGRVAVDLYLGGHFDCIVIETNRGGDSCVANLRTAARARGVELQVVPTPTTTRWNPRMIYVKTVNSGRSKGCRLEPVAPLYERGKVVHVLDADLGTVEEQLTTWEDEEGAYSPDAMDALVHGVWELAGLAHDVKKLGTGFSGYDKVRVAAGAARSAQVVSPVAAQARPGYGFGVGSKRSLGRL